MNDFIGLLYRYENGLDTAGCSEYFYFQCWREAIERGEKSPAQVMEQIRDRYSGNNEEVVQKFELLMSPLA